MALILKVLCMHFNKTNVKLLVPVSTVLRSMQLGNI